MSWAWGTWQILRGPSAGPPPQQDRNTLWVRAALYVAVATMRLLQVTASLIWADTTVIDSAVM